MLVCKPHAHSCSIFTYVMYAWLYTFGLLSQTEPSLGFQILGSPKCHLILKYLFGAFRFLQKTNKTSRPSTVELGDKELFGHPKIFP